MMNNMTLREEWLSKARDLIIEQVFVPHELRFPPLVKVSVAILTGSKQGLCCSPELSDEGAVNMFVSAELGADNVMDILGTLTRDLAHANAFGDGYLDHGCGHPYSETIRTVGLEGKPKTATAVEGTELYATLQGIAATLGVYPHMPIRKKPSKTRTSENLSWVSSTDPEYEVKCKFSISQEKGVPRDYNGEPMVPKDPEKFSALEDRTVEEIEEQEAAALPE